MVSRTNKFRGSRTHGRGKKAGRGAGIHGGRGNAGLHKHKFMHTLKFDPLHFGVHGFKRPQKMIEARKGITVATVVSQLPRLIAEGHARTEGGKTLVDLNSAGYYKLLSSGVVDKPLEIVVEHATDRAKAAVEKAGGSVTLK